jgi:hypothetical protein
MILFISETRKCLHVSGKDVKELRTQFKKSFHGKMSALYYFGIRKSNNFEVSSSLMCNIKLIKWFNGKQFYYKQPNYDLTPESRNIEVRIDVHC